MCAIINVATAIVVFILVSCSGAVPNVVTTTTGKVRGFHERALGRRLLVYLGVPYAEPPVGSLRFAKPVPKQAWEGVLTASRPHHTCPQIPFSRIEPFHLTDKWEVNTDMSEDCLFLNVWVPQRAGGDLSVLVWIHGGGFLMGSASLDLYNAKNLASFGDVIVVSINYRIGALGFLYLEDGSVPGNMGLLDQLLALRWIRDNIAAFGGDPEKVTLMGESAGASCVGYHLLSPLSAGLFSRAILQSSSPLCQYSFKAPEALLNQSRSLAAVMDCDGPHLNDTVSCLQRAPWADLLQASWSPAVLETIGIFINQFTPTVDGFFLQASPQQMLSQATTNNVPIMLGNTADEGTYFILFGLRDVFPTLQSFDVTRDVYTKSVAQIFPWFDKLTREVVQFSYSRWPHNTTDHVAALGSMMGDYHFVCPVNSFARQWADKGPDVFVYRFRHRTESSPYPEWVGVTHADDVDYTFGWPLTDRKRFTNVERKLSRAWINYLVSFARTGFVACLLHRAVHVPWTNLPAMHPPPSAGPVQVP